MALKNLIEDNPTLIILGMLLTGYLGGIATMSFLEQREAALRESILSQLKEDNAKLKVTNEELDAAVRRMLKTYVDSGEILKGKPLGGDTALTPKAREDVLKSLNALDSGELAHAIRDPTKVLKGLF